ncbi:MAG: UDP-N-acetylglucosamine 2-epimerase, partial [Clostridiales bacterium]|nr:UDP-N-acetylglucosamine 2-epimerase [Clostridiales bacterium]
MKICTIVGARPQFIKAAALSRLLREKHEELLIHTGQHFDFDMSGVFFKELGIPEPDYNLGVSGGNHGKMTGEMLIKIEDTLINERPDILIVYGDTNSTLAGALAAVKLQIPVCHVEAGNRLGTLSNPEEVNRVLTDHISSFLFCCVESSVEFLKKEGRIKNVYLVGDPMFDAFCYYKDKLSVYFKTIEALDFDGDTIDVPQDFYYLTCHRPENENEAKLYEILSAMNSLEYMTIYPVHPRNRDKVR